ncbi:hypothetical protein CWS43_12370 [Rahnella sp. AA]|uniref:hypothetical protein n=1 Tax=Rahnella sp. AA TaxID=2057180 RepID=UPI000C330CE8|nr:hypothetical protein [Rahnella sp. AA]PKE30411.1 hypothetical protein CWS43_12370 [Rahnella sp. AA]
MQLISNDYEYRMWMMEAYFCQDSIEGDKLLTEEELDDFLFEYRPQEYPCLGTVTPSKITALDYDITFFYRQQISEWAKSMGLLSIR